MGCSSCGGRASTPTYTRDTQGHAQPVVYRLHYAQGGTVDYWSRNKAEEDLTALRNKEQAEGWTGTPSRIIPTDPRTGEPIPNAT